jgi:hypothetical protein
VKNPSQIQEKAKSFFGDSLGPAKAGAVIPGGQSSNVGGEINIRVEDNRLSVTSSTSNPNVPINTDAGMSMLHP